MLQIKYFNVLDTTTGKMSITGRITSNEINTILSYKTMINDTVEQKTIAGTPTTINSTELLYGLSHMSTTFIKIVKTFDTNITSDCVFITDGIMRITYLGGTTSASNSLLYGFASSNTTALSDIIFNVLIAKNTSQTNGDYFDIQLPDDTFYPQMYIVFVLINSAWNFRTIVSGNTCSIQSNVPNFCINPSVSNYDMLQSHFIVSQCINSVYGIATRMTITMEDWIFNLVDSYTDLADRDYNDFIFSIGTRFINESMTNDTNIF